MVPVRKPQHLGALREVLHPYDYLLCVDLEATCDEEAKPGEPPRPLLVHREDMETIEIGLAVIDLSSLKVVDHFQSFVRPTLHPVLTDFCRKLTTIKQSDVDAAPGYARVAQMLDAFLEAYPNSMWCSWGDYDHKQLQKDASRLHCKPMLEGMLHTNLKKWHWKVFECRAMGLQPAVEMLGLEWEGTYHRGIDDARNVANVAIHLLS
ncbi:3'-5' exonuclease [Pseudomonas vanderleydeniana]|uniref:Exonuclease domain-containing protein n=1 Tax=Pseudomonas vanderleydeniana TaxID=2745495 RepID=A0A9E6PR61_9PSED|nr:3'-5' exonuclease [Pseudomonas vanderleydeniana]QXI31567.1 exonuclease domain-containing protein [Pseudomonas vanderleydeniana]